MWNQLTILGHTFSTYSLFLLFGAGIALFCAFAALPKRLNRYDCIILLGWIFLGTLLGSKLLYLLVNAKSIDWSRFFEHAYFGQLMSGGFVFYGGLLGGTLGCLVGARVHRLPYRDIIQQILFALPLAHAFGRVGCFCAGCCYGVAYHGACAVVFPEGSFAPSGVSLFPVQLLEAVLLLFLAALLFFLRKKLRGLDGFWAYLFGYGWIRFLLEFLRGDAERGVWLGLSTSQWIALGCIAFVTILVAARRWAGKPCGADG